MEPPALPETPAPRLQHIPLGVGQIITDSFAVLMANFPKVLIIGFIYPFAIFLFSGALLGFGVAAGIVAQSSIPTVSEFAFWFALTFILNGIAYALTTGMVVQLAYDDRLERERSVVTYFLSMFPVLLPILILNLAIMIMIVLGFFAVFVGALWVYAVFCLMVPAAVIEGAGFGALGRSRELTRDYRWPIVGLLIVTAVILSLLSEFADIIASLLVTMFGTEAALPIAISMGVVNAAVSGLSFGFGGITIALTYARLREIKEGVNVDEIAAVFE